MKVATSKSPMNEKVRNLLILLNISSSSYIYVLADLEKMIVKLYVAKNTDEEKNSRIKALNFKLNNFTLENIFF